ncbi:DNA methyltransferase [Curvibacter phage PCA1]|nr:DNA methyltransferase [Curvibacter phage PCA1]
MKEVDYFLPLCGLSNGQNDIADSDGHCGKTYLAHSQAAKGVTLQEWLTKWSAFPTSHPPPGGWGTEGAAIGHEGLLEWATLDAQWFGVAQRRRRVFAVADFGNWSGRPPVLLEPESVRGNTSPSRTTWRERTGGIANSFGIGSEKWLNGNPSFSHPTATPVTCAVNQSAPHVPSITLTANALDPLKTMSTNTARLTGNSKPENSIDLSFRLLAFGKYSDDDTSSTMQARDYKDVTDIIATVFVKATSPHSADEAPRFEQTEVSATLTRWDEKGFNPPKHIVTKPSDFAYQVRRLTPVEGERLQGFPDGYTRITYKGKPNSDSSRYMAIGNSMCVKVMRWIGYQLDFVHYYF